MIENYYFGKFLINVIFFFCLFLNYFKLGERQKTLLSIIICSSYIFLGIFGNAITPDYKSYLEIISEISATKDPGFLTHFEPFWVYFIHQIGNNYFLFRLIIFSVEGIILFLIVSFSKINNTEFFYFIFTSICLYWGFISGRSAVYVYFFILGLVLILKHKSFLGLLLIIISFFLHKSALYFIPLLLLSAFISPVNFLKNKTRTFLFIFLIIAIILTLNFLINQLIGGLFDIDDFQGINYIKAENSPLAGRSVIWKIIYTTQTLIFIGLSIYVISLFYKNTLQLSRIHKVNLNLLFWICIYLIIFYSLQLPDKSIGLRLLTVGYIPLSLLLTVLKDKNVLYKNFNLKIIVYTCAFVYFFLTNLYMIGVANNTYKF